MPVVLNCCAAGGALFSQSDNQIDRFERSEKYAKSVIYACPWKGTTTGELSTALLQVINNWRPDTTNLSAGTIVEDVGLILATKMLKAQRELTKENRGDKRSDCSDGERSLLQPGLFDLHSARDDGTKEQFLLTGRELKIPTLKKKKKTKKRSPRLMARICHGNRSSSSIQEKVT